MRISCPSCSAAYDVPDSLVTAGRIVRCARCGGEWTPVTVLPPEPEAPLAAAEARREPPDAPQPLAAMQLSAMDRLTAHAAWPRASVRLRLAWVGSVAVLVLLVVMAYQWRSDIVAAWPPSARAYAAFGLHPDTERDP